MSPDLNVLAAARVPDLNATSCRTSPAMLRCYMSTFSFENERKKRVNGGWYVYSEKMNGSKVSFTITINSLPDYVYAGYRFSTLNAYGFWRVKKGQLNLGLNNISALHDAMAKSIKLKLKPGCMVISAFTRNSVSILGKPVGALDLAYQPQGSLANQLLQLRHATAKDRGQLPIAESRASSERMDEAQLFARHFQPAPHFTGSLPARLEIGRLAKRARCSTCGIKWDEWIMVDALVDSRHKVIEFGARFGATSCRLARATQNSGYVVSIEPDTMVLDALLTNRDRHRCNFHVVSGTVNGAGMRVLPLAPAPAPALAPAPAPAPASGAPLADVGGAVVPNFNFSALERRIGGNFNAMLVDCEGCLPQVVATGLLDQVDLVLIEEDAARHKLNLEGINYKLWRQHLFRSGFKNVWFTKDTYNPKGPESSTRWSHSRRHLAWRRQVQPARDECEEYRKSAQLDADALSCLPVLTGARG